MASTSPGRQQNRWSNIAGLVRNRSLQNKIILTFLVVTLLSIGGITYFNNRATSESLTEQAGENLEELATARALNIGTTIVRKVDALHSFGLGSNVANSVQAQNEIYADQYESEWEIRNEHQERDQGSSEAEEEIVRSQLNNMLAELVQELHRFQGAFPGFSELMVTDQFGGLVATSFVSPDFYQGDETWWQDTYQRGEGQIFVSDPQPYPGGRRVIRVAVPIYGTPAAPNTGEGSGEQSSQRQVIGIISGLLDMSLFADTLGETDVGDTGAAELMFRTSSYGFGPRNGGYEFYSLNEPGAESLDTLKRAPAGHTEMTLFGEQKFVANAPVTAHEDKGYIDNLGWQVIVHQDRSEALQVVDETTRNTSLLAGAIAALVIFVGVVMGQHFARPILTLSEAMTRFTGGELSTRVHIKTGDETGTLAERFNEMADQMSSLFQRLESRRNELEQRTRQLDANQRAISVIFAASKQSGPEELLGLVVDMIRDQFDLYHVQIYMVDEAGETAVLREGTGYAGRQLMQQNHSIPLDQPALVSRAITQDEPVIVEDVEEAEDFLANPLLPDTQSELVVPLRLDNQVIGALDVQSNSTHKFNRDMITLFQTMAEQIAFLFENSQLLEQVSDQNETLTRFTTQLRAAAELGQRLGTIYESDELLHETVELIQSRFGFYHVHIYLLHSQKEKLVVHAGSGEVGRVLREKEHSIPIDADKSLVATAATSKDTVLVNDVSLESDFLPNPLLPQTRSEVAVPLIVRGEVLGVLDVQDDQAERFDDSDVNALHTLAGQIATALNSARLFEQLQNTLEQTRVRLTANEALATARTEKEVLDTILDQASLYEEVQVTIFLIDETEEDETFFEIYESRALNSGLTELQPGRRFRLEELALEEYAFDDITFTTKNAFEDDRVSEGIRKLMDIAGATSLAVVRLQIGDEWFGTLTIGSPDERTFDTHRIRLYEVLAERGALALREARLRKELTRIGQAVENTSDAIVISDVSGEAVYSNRAFTKLFGYTLEELNESGGAAALYHSEDDARQIFGEAMSGGSWTGELEMQSKAGDVVPVELRVDAFRDDEGAVVGAIGTMTDITERRTLREAGAAVAATLQRDEAIDRILDQLDRVVTHTSASVQLLRDGYIEIVGGKDWIQSPDEIIGLKFPIPGGNPNTTVVEERRPVILNTLEEIRQYPAFEDDPHIHIQSWMGVPLVFGDEVIGMLAMESEKENAFSPGDAQLVSAFGDHVAIAIENSRLFEQTEETLSQNRAMLNAVPDTIFRFDRDGVYLDVNAPEWEKLVAPKEEVIGKPLTEVLPPFVAEPAMNAITDAIETGKLQTFEYSLPLEAGMSHFEARIAPINDNEVLAMVRDITGRKEAQRTQERLTAILEATTDFVSIADADGNMLYINEAGRNMVGLDTDTDVTDLHISDFRPDADLGTDQAMQAVLSEGIWRGENVIQYGDDVEPIPVSQVAIGHTSDDGTLQYISTIARNISEQKQTEEELQNYASRLRTAANITEQLSSVLDPDELLHDIVNVLRSRFSLYHVHVYLLDEKREDLVMSAGSGDVGQKLRERGHAIPLDREQSLVARAARGQATVHVGDTSQDANFMPNPLLPDTRAEVAVPLVSRGELVGVLDVQDNKSHRFSETDIDTLNTVAGQIATAIQNARLFEQTEQALQESELRVQVNEALAETHSEQDVLDTIIDQAELYPEAQVTVLLTEEVDDDLHFVVRAGDSYESGLDSPSIGTRFPTNESPLSKYVQQHEVFVTNNAFEDERVDDHARAVMQQTGSTSMVMIQMRIGGEWLGMVTVASPHPYYFDDKKVNLYQILVERATIALHEARLQEAVQESEGRFRQMAESIDQAFWLTDVDRNELIYMSPSYEDIWGRSVESLAAEKFAFVETIHPEDRERVLAALPQQEEGDYDIEYRIVRPDGSVRWIRDRAFPIENENGEVYRVSGVAEDITEQKQAEEALRESEARNRAMLEAVPDMMFRFDRNGTYLDLHVPDDEKLIAPPEEVLGKPLTEVFPPVIAEPAMEAIEVATETGEMQEFEYSIPLGETTEYFEARIAAINENEVLTMVRDITDEKEAREALRESEERFRFLSEETAEGVFVHDEGTIIDVNEAGARMFGYDRSELIGQNALMLTTEESRETVKQHMLSDSEEPYEAEGQRKDGSRIVAQLQGKPAVYQDREVRVALVRDITQQKEAQEEMRRLNTMLVTQHETSPDGILIVNPDREFVFFNQRFTEIWDIPESVLELGDSNEALAHVRQQLKHPDEFVKRTNELYTNRERSREEIELKDGRVLDRFSAPMVGDDGTYYGRMWTFRDITERKRTQEALQDSQERYQTLFEEAPISLWEEDFSAVEAYIDELRRDGVEDFRTYFEEHPGEVAHCASLIEIDDLNQTTVRLFEAGDKETLLANLDSIFGESASAGARDALLKQLTAIAEGRKQVEVEAVNYTLSGERRHHRLSWSVAPGYEDTYGKVLVAVNDFTDRVRAERELENQRAFLRQVLDLNPHFIFAKDRQGRFTLANEALADAYGTTPSDLVGKSDADFSATDEEATHFHEDDLRVIENREEIFIPEEPITDVEGNERWLQTTKIPIVEDGEVTQLLGVSIDITEQKRAQEALRESEARNRALVDAIPDLMYRLNQDGTFLDVEKPSQHPEYYFYLPPDELVEYNISDVFPFDVSQKIMQYVEQTLESDEMQRFEYALPIGEGLYDMRDFEARFVAADNDEILAIVRDITEQKAAQKREQRLTDILEATPDFVSITDVEGRPLYLNEAGREMAGLDPDADISETRIPQFHPADMHEVIQNALRTAMQEGVWRGENVLQSRDGDRIPLSQVLIAHRSGDSGEVEYFSTIARDISDVKEAEEAMAQRLQYEERLAASSQALLSGDDIDERLGQVLDHLRNASDACRVYFFKSIESAAAGSYARQTHESCAPNVEPQIDNPVLERFSYEELGFADWAEQLSNGKLVAGTIDQFEEQQREVLENQGIKSVLLLPVHTSNGWYGSIGFDDTRKKREWSPEDIRLLRTAAELIGNAAERAEAQQELTRFTNQLRTAAEISEQINSILDPQQLLPEVVTLLQKRFDLYHVHIYLLDEEQRELRMESGSGSVGRKLRERGHSIALDEKQSLVARAAREQVEILVGDTHDEPAFMPNPLLPDTRAEVALPLIARGDVIGVLDVQDDMPARFGDTDVDALSTVASQIATALDNARLFEEIQQTAERLREVDRLKSEFLANMSHELRTPLNSIIGYAEIMLMGIDGELDDETLQDVQAIHENGQHLLELINDILDLAKIEAGRMKLDKKPVQIGTLFEEVKTSHLGVLHQQKKNLNLEIDIEDQLPPVNADSSRLNQILNNLVSNAIKFTDEGKIVMRAAKDNGWLRVEVRDSGVGISEADQRRIFERFRQVDGSSTRAAEGTGLGLAITHHLVEMHGGTIDVESELGEGSTFVVRLPIHTDADKDTTLE